MRAVLWFVYAAILLAVAAAPSLRAAFTDPVGCAQLPALTGDTTTAAGSCAVTGRLHLISTQTASASASLSWTALGSTYHTYFLSCYGLYPATTSNSIYLQYGEGGTPTWEGGTSYSVAVFELGSNSATEVNFVSETLPGVSVSGGTIANTAVSAVNFNGYFSDPVSTTQNKSFVWTSYTTAAAHVFVQNGAGAYMADTNAITALRIVAGPTPGTSNITGGTCSLFALVQ